MLQDAGTEHHRIQNTGPLWLPADGYLVLGRNADPTRNGAVGVAYQYGGFTLGNTDDEIILLDGAGTEIDRVAYDGGPTFPNPDGASMQLIRPDLDNTLGANWRSHPPLARQRRRSRLPRRRQSGHTPNSHGYGNSHAYCGRFADAYRDHARHPDANALTHEHGHFDLNNATDTIGHRHPNANDYPDPHTVTNTQRDLNGHRDANTNCDIDAIGHAEHGAAG